MLAAGYPVGVSACSRLRANSLTVAMAWRLASSASGGNTCKGTGCAWAPGRDCQTAALCFWVQAVAAGSGLRLSVTRLPAYIQLQPAHLLSDCRLQLPQRQAERLRLQLQHWRTNG